jgi:AcrR family transcriptional regulator
MVYRRTEKVVRRLAARHDAIIAAARALAAEAGMNAVQIAPVAERAGIAAGTVYRYFPSKTDLVGALVTVVSDHEIGAIRGAADAAPGPLSALAAAVTTFAARALRQRRLAWALIAEAVDADIERIRSPYRRVLASEFETRLTAAIAGKHLPEQDAAVAAPALVGALLEGLAGPLAAASAGEAKTREAVQTLALFALRAVGVADARARGLVVQTALPAEDAPP